MALGIHQFDSSIEIIRCPLADGGEGTLELLETHMSLERQFLFVKDPLLRPIESYYLKGEGVAYIEMAKASGLELLSLPERNPLNTSTYGTGELIQHAIDSGCKEINLCVGGSATNDGGVGMASVLGFQFKVEKSVINNPTGRDLPRITEVIHFDIPQDIGVNVLCDVENPLYGENGAAFVYAGQKGASPKQIEELDTGLRNLAHVLANGNEHIPGAGAAGGLGYGAISFLNARVKSGVEFLMDKSELNAKLQKADLVFTGEGRLDSQSAKGKVISGVVNRAKEADVPVAIICGQQQDAHSIEASMIRTLVNNKTSIEMAIHNSYELLKARAFEMMVELKTTL